VKPYYEEDGIVIFCGDSREVLPSLADKSIDLVLTDPPYGHNNNNGDLIHQWEAALGRLPSGAAPPVGRPIANDGAKEAGELYQFLLIQSKRLLDKGCCCCCCCCGGGGPDPQFARWALQMDEILGFKMCVVWDKGGLGMGWHYRRNWECVLVSETSRWFGGDSVPNVVKFPKIIPGELDHPTPKPIELMDFFIQNHTEPDDLVLDPFAGHGTTLRAAKDLRRRAIGIEIEEKYAEIAAKRLAQKVLDFK
jgi:site-specific DNA-methyltransferase (adenine-specific)